MAKCDHNMCVCSAAVSARGSGISLTMSLIVSALVPSLALVVASLLPRRSPCGGQDGETFRVVLFNIIKLTD
jgi:hypothetical protein